MKGLLLSLDASPNDQGLDDWFVSEILSLEPMLMRFLRRHWHEEAEIADLRQETYVRVYEAARRKRPAPVKPYVFFVARNLIIDQLRKKNVVRIETMADAEWLTVSDLEPMPDQRVEALQDMRRLQLALDRLPPRCRQVIILRRVYGFSQREVARKMGIKEETVESQIVKGMRLLTEALSDSAQPVRRFLLRKD